ncbi:hypothetical protein F6X40_39800 [Paraburkholderia sp. UCT31]|uniref:hypothetical protein n=1 Tax=Paraburkholderia sp. UCT31 TaxID=2615209 RepID=UPI001654E981|nr:hypothetical protein [Paraburkholderia sp. UCT31]MBC8742632.1 hypothetical protein [Paraburkholderia sp. UCT31]
MIRKNHFVIAGALPIAQRGHHQGDIEAKTSWSCLAQAREYERVVLLSFPTAVTPVGRFVDKIMSDNISVSSRKSPRTRQRARVARHYNIAPPSMSRTP